MNRVSKNSLINLESSSTIEGSIIFAPYARYIFLNFSPFFGGKGIFYSVSKIEENVE